MRELTELLSQLEAARFFGSLEPAARAEPVMAANPLHSVVAEQSHALELLARLLDLGIIRRGQFTLIHVSHDWDCPALASGSALDCRCNPEVKVGGRRYLYSDLVDRERAAVRP